MKISHLEPGVINNGNTTAQIPAGKYFFGDTCYTLGDIDDGPEWGTWVDYTSEMSEQFVLPISGAKIGEFSLIASSTAYGDGLYHDQDGVSYSVDAGLIGVTPIEFIEEVNADKEHLATLGRFIELTTDHVLAYNDGVITLTSVDGGEPTYTIDTN